MKITLRFLSLLLALLLLFSFAACDLILPGEDEEEALPFEPTPIPEAEITAFGSCYGEQLNVNEKAIYDAFAAAETGQTAFTVTFPIPLEVCRGRNPEKGEEKETKETLSLWLSNAVLAAWLDFPALFWIDFSDFGYTADFKQNAKKVVAITEIAVSLTPRMSAEEAKAKEAALSEKLKTIAPVGATAADKLYSLDFYLTELITYDLDAPNRATVAGALLDGRCVCEGYAHAFQLLCEALDIPCVCILGDATADGETEAHMWNAVYLDGAWYYCDITWNDTTASTRYLLVGSDTEGHEGSFAESHKERSAFGQSKSFLLPIASAEAYRPSAQ